MSATNSTQAFTWLVRRELWENRSLWLAPGAFALLVVLLLLAHLLSGGHVHLDLSDPDTFEAVHRASGAKLASMMSLGLAAIALPFFLIAQFLQFMYAVDSLYGERRDRSILFWKSMPVSDAQTVLSKFLIASFGVFVPMIAFAIATQLALAVCVTIDLREFPHLISSVWSPAAWGSALLVVAYATVAATLWLAPFVAWCLLVSVRAPRSPILWALLPPIGLALAELIVFHTHNVWRIIVERVVFFASAFGGRGFNFNFDEAGSTPLVHEVMQPMRFFTDPGLWLGLVVAGIFVALAIWSRRQGEATS